MYWRHVVRPVCAEGSRTDGSNRYGARALAADVNLFEDQRHADHRAHSAVVEIAQVHEDVGRNVGASNEAEAPVFFPSNERALSVH